MLFPLRLPYHRNRQDQINPLTGRFDASILAQGFHVAFCALPTPARDLQKTRTSMHLDCTQGIWPCIA